MSIAVRRSRWALGVAATIVAMAQGTSAQAQEAADTPPADTTAAAEFGSMAEVIVTSRRRDEVAQDVPAAVQAVSATELQELNIRDLEDVSSVAPGLSLGNNANGIGSVTTVRGVDFNVNASGENGTVQYYYNDAPVSSGVLIQSMYDVGTIEVLRGPQGTLKGRASPSGAISVTFQRPDLYEFGGYAQGTLNDVDGHNVNGAVNIPLVEGLLGIRVAGLLSNGEGSKVKPRESDNIDVDLQDKTESYRISLRATPFDGMLVLDASYLELDSNTRQYQQVQSGSEFDASQSALYPTEFISVDDRRSANYLPFDVDQHFENWNVSAQLFGFGQQLVYVGNWYKQHFFSLDPSLTGDSAGLFSDPFAAQYHVNFDPSIPYPILPTGEIVPLQQLTDSGSKNTSHEIRLQNEERVADLLDYVVGYLRFEQDTNTDFAQIAGIIPAVDSNTGLFLDAPGGAIFLPLQRPGKTKEESVYANVTLHPGEKVELSGGIRHIWYKTDAGVNLCSQLDYTGCFPNAALTSSLDKEATIYQLTGKYSWTDDLMTYASFGTSWRPDAQLVGGPSFPTERQAMLAGTDPEESKNFELGLKSNWMGGRLRANLVAYYQDFKDYPYRAPGSGVYGLRYAQPGSGQSATVEDDNYLSGVPVEVKGFEAELGFEILPNWDVSALLSYADGKIKNGSLACLDLDGDGNPDTGVTERPSASELDLALGGDGDPTTADTPGVALCNVTQRSASSAPFSATVMTQYLHPLNSSMEGVFRALYSMKGKSIGDPTNPLDSVDSYGLLNLFTGLRAHDGSWEVLLYGKNMFETERVLDRERAAAATQISGVGAFDLTNYYNISTLPPREFGVTARFAFGSR